MRNTDDPTARFGDRARAYAQFRPGYEDAVVDALLAGISTPLVADVGAGTGISSLALARRGARVIAIEPNDAMRARAEHNASVGWRAGTAHSTGLEDKSVDIVACFQSFHWFADDAAFDELARIARRRIAVVQYERDESDDFTRAYGELVRKFALDDTEQRRLEALKFFEVRSKTPRHTFASSQSLAASQL
ncbi:MAG: class I SAM-dependent methyltransferase, partial [Candidatus Eremiobacteraeota bacterium]|nr:class I SAM-dependent methyltransferase [Candidatus Eremiobacteraeota bacterium]